MSVLKWFLFFFYLRTYFVLFVFADFLINYVSWNYWEDIRYFEQVEFVENLTSIYLPSIYLPTDFCIICNYNGK